MITPMKKVTILCIESLKTITLEELRSMGLLHVIHLQSPTGSDLNYAKAELQRVQKAIDEVPSKGKKNIAPISDAADSLVDEVQKLIAERKESEEMLSQMKAELSRYEVYGELNPSQITALSEKGIYIRLFETEKNKKPVTEDDSALIYHYGKNIYGDCYVIINRGESPSEVTNANELRLPSCSISKMKSNIFQSEKALSKIQSRLEEIATVKDSLKNQLLSVSDNYTLKEVDAGMLETSGIAMIQGFCPVPRISELKSKAPKLGWGLKIEDPTEDDAVPTLIAYNKLSRPMKFLYDIIGISPGYNEMDVSMVFLAFFSIFFAMIVGDTAYGIIFLILTLVAQAKMPKAPKAAFHFLILMSCTTIIWGFLNNSFLGFSPAALDLAQKSFLPEGVRKVALWVRDASNVQYLCFILGVIHLTIAHIWNFILRLKQKSTTALAQLGWLFSTWFMFFLASNMVLKKEMPEFAMPLFITGLVLIVLFMVQPKNIKKEWISFPMLIFDVINNFVDIISYIRLFAVGMAGVAIAQAFNMMLSPLFGSAVGIAISVIALFFVHCLNIALGIMGVAVHALRLNTLEFSNHLGLQWSGSEFTPFVKQKMN
jgi:V/A-type H+/Na+-transporting ATPase subunit I